MLHAVFSLWWGDSVKALVHTTPLYEQAYEEIRKSILRGALKPGSKIKVGEIAEQLQISRTPLREGLRQLQKEGLIEISKSGVISVIELDRKDYKELCACRLVLEQAIIKLVIEEITEEQLASLEQVLQNTEKAIEENNQIELLSMNAKFHETMIHVTSNRRLIQLLEQVRSLLLIYRANILSFEGHELSILKEHWKIFEAIKNKNVDEAVAAIHEHLNQDLKRGLQTLDQLEHT